jgi:CspA family cold shock protein
MARGTVEFFDATAGCGLIAPEDADEEIFFKIPPRHDSSLKEGREVSFQIVQTPEGPRAENIRPA